ncbi:MAG: MFS transporter [Nodosilinea sp.]
MSYGLINFYIPILFVNQMGFSATAVGFALSLYAVTEVAGHFVGGTLADSPRFGRKAVVSLAAGLVALVSAVLGGWAMDQTAVVAQRFSLGVGLSATVCIALLWVFETMRLRASPVAETASPELS